MDGPKDEGDFTAADVMLGMVQASKNVKEIEVEGSFEMHRLKMLLSVVSETPEGKGFAMEYYVPFFKEVAGRKAEPALAAAALRGTKSKEIDAWIAAHPKEMAELEGIEKSFQWWSCGRRCRTIRSRSRPKDRSRRSRSRTGRQRRRISPISTYLGSNATTLQPSGVFFHRCLVPKLRPHRAADAGRAPTGRVEADRLEDDEPLRSIRVLHAVLDRVARPRNASIAAPPCVPRRARSSNACLTTSAPAANFSAATRSSLPTPPRSPRRRRTRASRSRIDSRRRRRPRRAEAGRSSSSRRCGRVWPRGAGAPPCCTPRRRS